MKRAIKILAGIAAILLIIILLIFTMAFTGNPISKVLATRTAEKYIQENYSDLELHREETIHNFKDGNYGVKYANVNSKDIHFTIGTDYLGRLVYDGYERDVLSKWNTRYRIENEYNDYVEKIVRDNLDYDFDMIIPSTFGDEEGEERASDLEIDMKFALQTLPFDQYLTVYIYEENRSWERLSEVMLEIDELMEKNNININKYSVILEEPKDPESPMGEMLEVLGFPKAYINSEDLPKSLEDFMVNPS